MQDINLASENEQRLNAWIDTLLAGPQQPEAIFCSPDIRYADLYAMAADLLACFSDEPEPQPVCLCSDDRLVITAALLASLAGGPTLILPYATSEQVISELHRLTGVSRAIMDAPLPMPGSMACIVPQIGSQSWSPPATLKPRQAQSQWVRLFTGGSTGTPKMWTKTVRNLLAETLSIINHYEVTAADRILATVSPAHIYGLLYAVLTPLLSGASVAARTPSFPNEIEAALQQQASTIFVSVPAHYRALKSHPVSAPTLRLAFSSAGMLAPEDAHAFSEQTGAGIAEIYGSTETGGIAVRIRAHGETDFKAYGNIAIKIEDEQLMVRSDYLSPELETDADGYFVIPDRARYTVNDRFELLGRADGIVKVGGKRVDLEQVRHAIKQIPEVKEVLVIALPQPNSRENRIVAVIEGKVAATDISHQLMETLEPYQRPRAIKVVDEIPITAAGKFDRKTITAYFE